MCFFKGEIGGVTMDGYVISYDVGTTGMKTSIYHISNKIHFIASKLEGYELHIGDNGEAEQDPYDWWHAMCSTTRELLRESGIAANKIKGISFCSQMQGLVLVDKGGEPVRRAMSYLDNRASQELKEGFATGIKFDGANVFKLLRSINIIGAAALSVKDPVWKYKWVERNEKDVFEKVHKWLDVKEFLICKCTGEFVMTEDSAFATLLYDTRKGRKSFSKEICQMFGVNMDHLPKIVESTDVVGELTAKAAEALHLNQGTLVFGGGGDASLIGVGAGAVAENDTHIYLGTSGWVSTVVTKRVLDIKHMIASIVGANPNTFNYFAELETAGKCLEWVRDHLALDEINVYLERKQIDESDDSAFETLYDYMMHAIKNVPAGSNGVIFTPWLHGNRNPFEDPNARGMFFNIGLNTGKTDLIHAVLEGVGFHLRWQLEASEKKVETSSVIRVVGGGALAPLTCQILADILEREIETVDRPQDIGAVGATVMAAIGLGHIEKIEDAKKLIQVKDRFFPNRENSAVYDKQFKVFKTLYYNNKKAFHALN